MTVAGCEFCDGDGGEVIFRAAKWRALRVTGADGEAYRGYCRVVWNTHVKELTDLDSDDRDEFMRAVFAVEGALRASLSPHKMNVASLGNLTPHLHWHVIPRYADDPAFPKPVWAQPLPAHFAGQIDKLGAQESCPADAETERGDWEKAVRLALESV